MLNYARKEMHFSVKNGTGYKSLRGKRVVVLYMQDRLKLWRKIFYLLLEK